VSGGMFLQRWDGLKIGIVGDNPDEQTISEHGYFLVFPMFRQEEWPF
jgi:hypothetical protein